MLTSLLSNIERNIDSNDKEGATLEDQGKMEQIDFLWMEYSCQCRVEEIVRLAPPFTWMPDAPHTDSE